MTASEIDMVAAAAAEAATGPVRRPLILLCLVIFALGGGGGTWAYHTDGQMAAAAKHEKFQDKNIARNGRTIRQISVLLVQQGRHFEVMVRASAANEPLPRRPHELDAIEGKILGAAPVE